MKEIMELEEKQAEINLAEVYGKLSCKTHQKSFRRKMKQGIYSIYYTANYI
ncbi:MAG: hypothetical protein HFI29_12660 [Lachnospiraceae bacterium]|jgi:hypothetical protein|nr:hypothetical protein [Lachnospiraceae bacterium]